MSSSMFYSLVFHMYVTYDLVCHNYDYQSMIFFSCVVEIGFHSYDCCCMKKTGIKYKIYMYCEISH